MKDLERIHDLLPPCPTCGGNDGRSSISSATICPDCVDGKVPIEQLVARWNAVQECFHYDDGSDEERGGKPYWDNIHTPAGDITTAGDFLTYLRSVKP